MEDRVLAALKKTGPEKKRVTFFILKDVKSALGEWCREKGISESGAIEEMIRATVPARFFQERK